jgi:GTP-binding protein Era
MARQWQSLMEKLVTHDERRRANSESVLGEGEQVNFEQTTQIFRSGFVAIVGKPNVGKSTLLNAYLGQKVAIVSDKPQTTRVRQLGILTRPDAQVIFVDTPGIHQPLHRLGQAMVESATHALGDADVMVFVCDVSELPTDEDRQIAALIHEQAGERPVLLALNKMDRLPAEKVKQHTEAYWSLLSSEPKLNWDWMMLSATTGDNLDKLLDMIVARLPEGPLYYPEDQVTDRTEREVAADLIREQVLRLTRQEVPHAVAVVVDEWDERRSGAVHVGATIYVEKESQKGIIIGKGGAMLKKIGAAARQEIAHLTGARVFLELWVKVRKEWRAKESDLRELGYVERGE